jgi:hypothetical protein
MTAVTTRIKSYCGDTSRARVKAARDRADFAVINGELWTINSDAPKIFTLGLSPTIMVPLTSSPHDLAEMPSEMLLRCIGYLERAMRGEYQVMYSYEHDRAVRETMPELLRVYAAALAAHQLRLDGSSHEQASHQPAVPVTRRVR